MKKKLLKIGLILFSVGLLAGIGTYIYVFHKPHRNIAKEEAAFALQASTLYAEFSSDEQASYQRYGNKVLQVTGDVADMKIRDDGATIILEDEMEGISCAFDSVEVAANKKQFDALATGSMVRLKGQCDGFDMIMGVVLTRCVLLE